MTHTRFEFEVLAGCGYSFLEVSGRRLGEHRRWPQNGHNKLPTLTS